MTTRVYLDWNATTPLRPQARAAMATAFAQTGNPSSVHAEGRAARASVESARRAVAAAVGAEPGGVIFTSGGTEANALALTPEQSAVGAPLRRLLVSAIEHPSVLAGGRFGPSDVGIIAVTPDGVVDCDDLRARLADGPTLVSVMVANNETGAIQPVSEIAAMVHAAGGLLHVDAVQVLGKLPLDIKALGADMLSLSAHKVGGPVGVGALVLRKGIAAPASHLRGGGQEQGRRAGTENHPGIAGFGAAVQAATADRETTATRVAALRARLDSGLAASGCIIFCQTTPRLPNTTLFSAPGLRAETAVIAFDLAGIAVSSGSACSSGKVQPSHVLKAMGVPPDVAGGAIRISLGWSTTEADIDRCLEAWRKLRDTLLEQSDETELERF